MLVGTWDYRECWCGICGGTSQGKCGYRPHLLSPSCWCITGTRTECTYVKWLRINDITGEGEVA